MPSLPPLVALMGNPRSGKTTAARILGHLGGYELVDDGRPMREIAMRHLGLTESQVFTQDGKLETVTINGRNWVVREILGEIGNAFEEKFGGDVIPLMSKNSLGDAYFDPTRRFVFGSVRREQGFFWKKEGAMVIEIVNPAAPPSPFEFDVFNASMAHVRIQNDGLSRGLAPVEAMLDLEQKLKTALGL